jgi:hypothetical protein
MTIRVALVSCVKKKRPTSAPAGELYTSPLFAGLRRYALTHADRWYILSAEHGLLSPDTVIASYEKTLNKMLKADRVVWAHRVQEQLKATLPERAEVILLAGARYREGIEDWLRERGYPVSVPLDGLSLGRQLQRLKQG